MHCEEVWKELARDVSTPELRADIDSHLTRCASCRSVRLLFEHIDKARRGPSWEPPEGFARRVAAHVGGHMWKHLPWSRLPTVALFTPVTRGLLFVTVMYGGAAILVQLASGMISIDSDGTMAALDAYRGLAQTMTAALVANAAALAWTSAGLSLASATWFIRRAG